MQTYRQYMKEQDLIQAEAAHFESLCEEWEDRLERQEPSAVESFKEWLYEGWHDGTLPIHSTLIGMQQDWAEVKAGEQMQRDKEARE